MDTIEKLKGVRISSLDEDDDQEPVNIDNEAEDYDDYDDDEEQEPATLGFVEKPKDECLLYRQCFPSKAGVVPAWLDPVNLPSGRSFMCDICGEPLQFLLQHEQWKRHPEKRPRSVKIFRCQLSRINPFYSIEPRNVMGVTNLLGAEVLDELTSALRMLLFVIGAVHGKEISSAVVVEGASIAPRNTRS